MPIRGVAESCICKIMKIPQLYWRSLVLCLMVLGGKLGLLVYAQCDEATCTQDCFPEVWKRDLCQFYSQIWSWRLTAEGCGLSLPALPTRDGSASAGEQWEQARDYWKMIFDIWRNETQDTGIFEQDPPTSGILEGAPNQSSWVQQVIVWEEQYTMWNNFTRQHPGGGGLPESRSMAIARGLVSDERAASVRANSRDWSALVSDWSASHIAYNNTFGTSCSNY